MMAIPAISAIAASPLFLAALPLIELSKILPAAMPCPAGELLADPPAPGSVPSGLSSRELLPFRSPDHPMPRLPDAPITRSVPPTPSLLIPSHPRLAWVCPNPPSNPRSSAVSFSYQCHQCESVVGICRSDHPMPQLPDLCPYPLPTHPKPSQIGVGLSQAGLQFAIIRGKLLLSVSSVFISGKPWSSLAAAILPQI